MYTKLKPLSVRARLLELGMKVFTPRQFSLVFGTGYQTTRYFLMTQTKAGWLGRLKNGLYVLKTDSPSEKEVANALYRPSYISFEYVLGHYGILPEMSYSVTSATTKSTRLFRVGEVAFSYRTIKKSAYTGYELVRQGDERYLIAEPEKALIDYLYLVALGKITASERLVIRLKRQGYYGGKELNERKLKRYADLFNSKRLSRLVGEWI